jgi:hypothetical protein
MKTLFFITGHRHLSEYGYQKILFEKFDSKFDFDVIAYSNSSNISKQQIQNEFKGFKKLKDVYANMPNCGYTYGGLHSVRDAYHLFNEYDVVVQHHPDVFIFDSKRLFSNLHNMLNWKFDFLVSLMVHNQVDFGYAKRNISNKNLYFNTDMFAFCPQTVDKSTFTFNLEEKLAAEHAFTRAVEEKKYKTLMHDRSRLTEDGLYEYTDSHLGAGPDYSGVFHCHDLTKLKNLIT